VTDQPELATATDVVADQATVAAFARAYEAGDLEAVIALLTDDAFVSMPPIPLEYCGRAAVAQFYAAIMRQGVRVDLVPTRANGQPAFGMYRHGPNGVRQGTGLLVLTLAGGRIRASIRFESSVFPWFGLPRSLPPR
jgi:SnoaL-like protein